MQDFPDERGSLIRPGRPHCTFPGRKTGGDRRHSAGGPCDRKKELLVGREMHLGRGRLPLLCLWATPGLWPPASIWINHQPSGQSEPESVQQSPGNKPVQVPSAATADQCFKHHLSLFKIQCCCSVALWGSMRPTPLSPVGDSSSRSKLN